MSAVSIGSGDTEANMTARRDGRPVLTLGTRHDGPLCRPVCLELPSLIGSYTRRTQWQLFQ